MRMSQNESENECDTSHLENLELHHCSFKNCSIMPLVIESKSCREYDNLLESKLKDVTCITKHKTLKLQA